MVGKGKGWICLYRDIQEHWIWQDPIKLKWWLDLLLLANHEDKKTLLGNELIEVKRGERHTSELKLAERWGTSKTTVRKFLLLLEKDNMIELKKSKKGTTYKVINYNAYQENSSNKKTIKKPFKYHKVYHTSTMEEPQKNHKVYTNNNDNNYNNYNNDNNKREIAHSIQSLDLIKYYSELLQGQDISAHMATLNIWIEMYGYEWTKEAIQKCVSNKKKFIKSYIEVILKNWARDGKEENYGGTRQDNGESKFKGFRPAKPKISENIDTSDLI